MDILKWYYGKNKLVLKEKILIDYFKEGIFINDIRGNYRKIKKMNIGIKVEWYMYVEGNWFFLYVGLLYFVGYKYVKDFLFFEVLYFFLWWYGWLV